jgi:hypothetical protein
MRISEISGVEAFDIRNQSLAMYKLTAASLWSASGSER